MRSVSQIANRSTTYYYDQTFKFWLNCNYIRFEYSAEVVCTSDDQISSMDRFNIWAFYCWCEISISFAHFHFSFAPKSSWQYRSIFLLKHQKIALWHEKLTRASIIKGNWMDSPDLATKRLNKYTAKNGISIVDYISTNFTFGLTVFKELHVNTLSCHFLRQFGG